MMEMQPKVNSVGIFLSTSIRLNTSIRKYSSSSSMTQIIAYQLVLSACDSRKAFATVCLLLAGRELCQAVCSSGLSFTKNKHGYIFQASFSSPGAEISQP